ncbi:unnamed protein product [Plutella xylostella]|uniref:(diamondback moth) hypothetical protein n=1 Tax=Plutella xylostella TaxID=51655 RepID=A0A8S4DPP0_PLUXY|nr:ovarian-specific serine/threonine-protein kinase Lok [Plutella xylostella]CAG9102216.1 unnamed protein product [Plutella xylostella]
MAEECSQATQTQTQNSQVEWSQHNTPTIIPNIWGRIYSTKGRHCWKEVTSSESPGYYDLIKPEFTLGRALNCSFVMKKDIIKDDIIKNVSKLHFVLKRDTSEPLSPAIITDLSYNGTYVNNVKIGKGNSRVLDDNDEIAITHPVVKIFVFKDLLKNEQDKVPKEISQKYYISRTLGQGACGLVKLVVDKTKCVQYAMKIIKKSRLTNGHMNNLNDPAKIMNEINIMKALRHPCIISTEEVYDSPDTVYIILELMQGGELFERITKHGHLTERLTRFMLRQMVLAVRYLHSKGITHRDLKPENVLLEGKEEETLVKITDFGLSKFVGEDSFMKTMCGTPLYLAPEVLRANGTRCYGPEVDVWSLGVIFFICLVGYLPFSADYKELSLRDQILSGRFRFSQAHWRGVSPAARQLMKRMLTVQAARRITLDQILQHPWMQDAEVTARVEELLCRNIQSRNVMELTISSTTFTSSEEDTSSNTDNTTVIAVMAKGKRALSDSYSSCEPIPKKLRVDMFPMVVCEPDGEDTSSGHSAAYSVE